MGRKKTTEFTNPLIITVTNNNYSKLLEKNEAYKDTGDGTYSLSINAIPMYTPEDSKIRNGKLTGWQKEIQDKLKYDNYDSVVIRYDTNQRPLQRNMDVDRNGNHYIGNNLVKAQNLVSIIDRIYKTDHNKRACPIASLYEWGKEKRAYFMNFTKSAFGKMTDQRPKSPSNAEIKEVAEGILNGKINMLEQADAEPLTRLPGESDKDWNKALLEHYQSDANLTIRDSQHPIHLSTFNGDFRNRKLLNMINSDGSYSKPNPNDPEAVEIYNEHIKSDDYAASMINHKTPDDEISERDQPMSKKPQNAYNSKGRYYEKTNHLAMLTEPKRGLTNENLDGLWSVEPMNLDPAAIGSELVGCNMAHRMSYTGITISKDGQPFIGDGASIPLMGLVTKDSGIVIPMKNAHGDSVRPQIMTEPRSAMETEMVLKNGKTFARKEFQARHNYIDLPGGPGALELIGFKGKTHDKQGNVVDKGGVMFKDNDGKFVVNANKNENMLDTLKSRGYQFPSSAAKLTMAVDPEYAALNNGKPLGYDSLRLVAETADKTHRFALPVDQRLIVKSDHQSLCLTDNVGNVNNLHTEANQDVYHAHDENGNYHTYIPLAYTDSKGEEHKWYVDAANMTDGLKHLVNIPENVKKVQGKAGAKYCWPIKTSNAKGTDLGLTSAHAGFNFVEGSKPNYDVLVVEGALKGKIVTELAKKKDKTGKSFQEALSPNGNSLAIVQIPGVQQTGSIDQIKKLNQLGVPIDRVHIAMDTDASENRMVASGISSAEHMLKHYFPNSQVDVMKWGGGEKGLDDAMVAVLDGKASYDNLNFEYGETKEMYPNWWLTPDKRRSLKVTLGDDYPKVNYETTNKAAYEDMLRKDGITEFKYGAKPESVPNSNKRYSDDDLSVEDQESLDAKNAIFADMFSDSDNDKDKSKDSEKDKGSGSKKKDDSLFKDYDDLF